MLLTYPLTDDQDGQRLERAKYQFCCMVKGIVQGPDVNPVMYKRLWTRYCPQRSLHRTLPKVWPIRSTRKGRTGSKKVPAPTSFGRSANC